MNKFMTKVESDLDRVFLLKSAELDEKDLKIG